MCSGCAFVNENNECEANNKVVDSCGCKNDNKLIFKKLEKVGEPYMLEAKKFQKYRVFHTPYIYNKIDYSWQSFADPYYVSLELKQNKEDMEEKKLNLKPFDIQKAREGKPVCTRDGRKARIICFDRVGDFPIVALTDDRDYKEEGVNLYDINGKGSNECFDLMMLPEKKEGWVNVAKEPLGDDEVVLGYIFNSYEDAVRSGKANERYVATVRIEWEG